MPQPLHTALDRIEKMRADAKGKGPIAELYHSIADRIEETVRDVDDAWIAMVQPVVRAFQGGGRWPWRVESYRVNLRRDWPELYFALESLCKAMAETRKDPSGSLPEKGGTQAPTTPSGS